MRQSSSEGKAHGSPRVGSNVPAGKVGKDRPSASSRELALLQQQRTSRPAGCRRSGRSSPPAAPPAQSASARGSRRGTCGGCSRGSNGQGLGHQDWPAEGFMKSALGMAVQSLVALQGACLAHPPAAGRDKRCIAGGLPQADPAHVLAALIGAAAPLRVVAAHGCCCGKRGSAG